MSSLQRLLLQPQEGLVGTSGSHDAGAFLLAEHTSGLLRKLSVDDSIQIRPLSLTAHAQILVLPHSYLRLATTVWSLFGKQIPSKLCDILQKTSLPSED